MKRRRRFVLISQTRRLRQRRCLRGNRPLRALRRTVRGVACCLRGGRARRWDRRVVCRRLDSIIRRVARRHPCKAALEVSADALHAGVAGRGAARRAPSNAADCVTRHTRDHCDPARGNKGFGHQRPARMPDVYAEARHEAVDFLRHLQKRHCTQKPDENISHDGFLTGCRDLSRDLAFRYGKGRDSKKRSKQERHAEHSY